MSLLNCFWFSIAFWLWPKPISEKWICKYGDANQTTINNAYGCLTGGSVAERWACQNNDCFFVWVPLCPLNYLFLSCPEFKASPTLVNRQLITSCQLGFLNLVVFYYFGSCVFIVCVRYGMPSTLTSASINKPFFLKLIFSLE